MTTTSPALPASRPTILSRLAGLRRRIPTVILFAAVSFTGWSVDYALVLILLTRDSLVGFRWLGVSFRWYCGVGGLVVGH